MAKSKTASRVTADPIDKKTADRVREKLITARVGLLLKKPFFGNLATRLELTPADGWCETAATDGRKFYYNHKFVDSLRPREVEFLFGHEVLHVVYDHMGRIDARDKRMWNVAADYAINLDLVDQKVGELITTVAALYDTKYRGKCAEEIYDELFKNAKKINLDDLLDQLLDEHMDGDPSDGDGKDGGDSSGQPGEGKPGSGKPKLSEEEKRQIRDEIKEAVLAAAQQCSAGDLPAGIKRMIGDLTAPKMNWRELLRQSLESTMVNDYSWLRPDRKGWHMDAIMPGMVQDERIDIAVAIDMSGSISEAQGRDFLSEIQGIMNQFGGYRIHVWCFDTQVYNPRIYQDDDCEDITSYQLAGGGGTSFECNWEFMKENNIEPKRFIMFTDMYPCGGWGDANYCPTIFVAHSGGYGSNNIEAPFGVTVQYDQNAQ